MYVTINISTLNFLNKTIKINNYTTKKSNIRQKINYVSYNSYRRKKKQKKMRVFLRKDTTGIFKQYSKFEKQQS